MSLITINVSCSDDKLDEIIKQLNQLEQNIMALQDDLDAITSQLNKIFTEVTGLKARLEASISDLEAKIASGNTLDLTALKAAVQSIDDIVPDVVA